MSTTYFIKKNNSDVKVGKGKKKKKTKNKKSLNMLSMSERKPERRAHSFFSSIKLTAGKILCERINTSQNRNQRILFRSNNDGTAPK